MSLPSLIVFKPNAPLDFLVVQYLSGMPANMAIEQAGANFTERNIQKMAKSCGRVRMGPVPAAGQPAPMPNLLKRQSYNFRVDQTEKLAADQHQLDRAHIDAHKLATAELRASQGAREKAGGVRGGIKIVDAIIKDVNDKLPPDVKRVSRSSVARDVQKGRAVQGVRRGRGGRAHRQGKRLLPPLPVLLRARRARQGVAQRPEDEGRGRLAGVLPLGLPPRRHPGQGPAH